MIAGLFAAMAVGLVLDPPLRVRQYRAWRARTRPVDGGLCEWAERRELLRRTTTGHR